MKPNILLLVKHSSYDNYFKGSGKFKPTLANRLPASEIKRFKKTHDIHYASLAKAQRLLKSLNLNFKTYFRGASINYDAYDFILTIGGDGTFLEASHRIKNQLILGVNSDPSWSVGRFCAATIETLEHYLNDYITNRNHVQLLNRFDFTIKSSKTSMTVLNDILICHKNPGAMSRYLITFNNQKEEQRSSGIWIATAAGSTGAIRSAGGTVLPPVSRQLQYKPRELYLGNNPNYQLKGGLFEQNDKLLINSLMREGSIFVDGSHIAIPFTLGEQLTIKTSKYPLRMITK